VLKTESIRLFLQDSFPDWGLFYYPRLESTNIRAWELFKRDNLKNALVITDYQTAGRGRGSNRWFAQPKQGLTFSWLCASDVPATEAGLLPLRTGLAVADALAELNFPARLKWPNDIYLNSRKVGGILCESRVLDNKIHSTVTGIGLNVNDDISQFPAPIQAMTTSLRNEAGVIIEREKLLLKIIRQLWEKGALSAKSIIKNWLAIGLLIEKNVSVLVGNSRLDGKFKGIDNNGAALIEIAGKIQAISSGEMSSLREI